jgi:hypothetical protein
MDLSQSVGRTCWGWFHRFGSQGLHSQPCMSDGQVRIACVADNRQRMFLSRSCSEADFDWLCPVTAGVHVAAAGSLQFVKHQVT